MEMIKTIMNMKNITTYLLGVLLFVLAGCSPQYSSNASLGKIEPITPEILSFDMKVSEKSDNVLTFVNTTDFSAPHSVRWDLGNGSSSNQETATAQYPRAGEYTITLFMYAADGSEASLSKVITIKEDDFSLIDTPTYNMLTGGADNTAGKTWVLDKYNNYISEVAKETGKDIKGHYGLGEQGSYGQGWWAAGPADKEGTMMEIIYDAKFTFIQEGTQLLIANNGKGGGRKASAASVGGFNVTATDGDDVLFDFAGGKFGFSLDETLEYPKLTLTDNSFLGYYCGSQEYEIIYLTDEVMGLRVNNTVESQDWVFVYCLEELNVEKPKEVKAIPLKDDFEAEETAVNFVADQMSDLFSTSYSNPAPIGINKSSKVCAYDKGEDFYTNLSFTADYKFDLSEINKVRVKVFIPEYNDYETEHAVAGEWITNKKLLPQLAVKLHNSEKGDGAWETQHEIVKANLEAGKWLSLEFDFSAVKDRLDFDKIVIQFGGEGHAAPGIFFLDDFSFDK